ncbi:MAG: thiol peroxidase [Oligoflexia bacterium]|nr:thiol peroxidase [Oligoflexia bacterium]
MNERKGVITMMNGALTLLGDELKVGTKAPEATVLSNDLKAVNLSSYKGRICVISVVPSLDTSVCDTQTRRFNQEATCLGNNVEVLTLSMDLPFAQKRWCGAAGVDRVTTLSDHRDAHFGAAYGVLIKELRLLARAVFVIDKEGIVRYTQIVKEVTHEPNYDEALSIVKKLL